MDGMGHGNTRLSTWLSVETKGRFSAAAARQDLSESALLKRLVEQMLSAAPVETNGNPPQPGGMPPVATDNERIARRLQRVVAREEQRMLELSR